MLQRYPNLEYLVMDGGSTDGSVEIIKKYSPWIDYWISESDGGQSAAINSGLKRGTGTYATWINSDDLLCKDALTRQAAEIIRDGAASDDAKKIFSGICQYVDATGREISKHQSTIHTLEELVRIDRIWRANGHIVQPEVLFPRRLALNVGGLDPENHNTMDYEFWGKLLIAGARFRYTEVPFGIFREQPEQKTQDVLRQTQSLVNSAMKLVRQSDEFSETARNALLDELHQFGVRYDERHWKASGRIARLGLPREVVLWLRRLWGGGKRVPASEPRK